MPYARKNLKVEASLSENLITSVCTDVRKKTQNSIQCLKIMGLVQIAWFHGRIVWKKNWQCFWHVTRYTAYKPEDLRKSFREHVVSGWIFCWNESQIGFSMWNFLYREITTKYVSCENLVNFLFCYLYIKLFLAHIENQYI